MWFWLYKTQNIVLNLIEETYQFCHFMTGFAHGSVDAQKGQCFMSYRQQQTDSFLDDPIELVTRFVITHDWLLQRRDENVVLVEVPGKWCDYQLAVVWRDNEAAMQVSCRIDEQTDPMRYGEMALLASLLNKQIFIGHLALDVTTGELEMLYTLALRGAGGATPEQIEDVVDIMLGECENCYPAIYQVANHGVSATDAADLALFNAAGEA